MSKRTEKRRAPRVELPRHSTGTLRRPDPELLRARRRVGARGAAVGDTPIESALDVDTRIKS